MTRQTHSAAKLRLDQLLVARHGYESRSRARDAILRGSVLRNGQPVLKPGEMVAIDTDITICDDAARYVSRAALKLVHALEHVQADTFFDPKGRTALDIGASTGGFTQVLLEAGARHVIALDVGSGQFHESLRGDPRITLLENLNARDLSAETLAGHSPEFLVCDASFISLRLVLPPALSLAQAGAAAIFLIKPQFEVGRELVGKGGIVRDGEAAENSAREIAAWLDMQPGWAVRDLITSPIVGSDGNREYLLFARKERS